MRWHVDVMVWVSGPYMIRPVHVLSGGGEPRGEKIPERGRGWGNFSPVEANGDGDRDFLTPRGRVWEDNPRRGNPHCHL
jgi:hypothetical protein